MAARDSFEDVRGLTEPELRRLLERGRPEQRVWAIWALAMRSSSADTPTLDAITQHAEPAPGVRRNLAVVLAGHGQYELLVALAKRDPAPEVRAAAMQLVARIAADGKLPATLVTERVVSESAEVKVAVLGTIFAGAPGWLGEIAEQLLEDRDADVRYEAFEALVRADYAAPALMWLEEAREGEARTALMRWTARGRVLPAATMLASSSRRLRQLLVESVRVATWQDLAPAVGSEPILVRALAGRVPHIVEQIPLATLVRASLGQPGDPWMITIGNRLAALEAPETELGELLPRLIDLCSQRIAEIDMATAKLPRDRDPYDEIDAQELADERTVFERALEAAYRLLVH